MIQFFYLLYFSFTFSVYLLVLNYKKQALLNIIKKSLKKVFFFISKNSKIYLTIKYIYIWNNALFPNTEGAKIA